MGIIRIEIKLYRYHDLDLVSLYKSGRIDFPETTRQILNAYARKEVFRVRPLDEDKSKGQNYNEWYSNTKNKRFTHYHIELDEEEDAEAILLLKQIRQGFRNNFIKTVLRQYLCGIIDPVFIIDGDVRFYNDMAHRFQAGRDEVDIRRTKRKNKVKEVIPKIGEEVKSKNKKKKIGAAEQKPKKNDPENIEAEEAAVKPEPAKTEEPVTVEPEPIEPVTEGAETEEPETVESEVVESAAVEPETVESDFDDFLLRTTEQY